MACDCLFLRPDHSSSRGGLLCCPRPPVRSYAGAAFEREEDAAGEGQLLVKGIKSMWRQVGRPGRCTPCHRGSPACQLARDTAQHCADHTASVRSLFLRLCGRNMPAPRQVNYTRSMPRGPCGPHTSGSFQRCSCHPLCCRLRPSCAPPCTAPCSVSSCRTTHSERGWAGVGLGARLVWQPASCLLAALAVAWEQATRGLRSASADCCRHQLAAETASWAARLPFPAHPTWARPPGHPLGTPPSLPRARYCAC